MKLKPNDEVEFDVRVAGSLAIGHRVIESIHHRVATVKFCGREVTIFLSELRRVKP
jgi:hypothetical protein